MIGFLQAFPALFHVTHASAVDSIRAHGLLPAVSLAPADAAEAILENRPDWTLVQKSGHTAWLRWQRMPDGPIGARLRPGIEPAAWRLFINHMVFFFGCEADAQRLRNVDPERSQVVLRYRTAALLEAGCALLTCRFNNGFLDRRPLTDPRLRSFDDYRPAGTWRRGDPLREITAWGGVPADVPFDVITITDPQP